MSDGSKIEWTDATWNPLVGCTKVSPGCDHCYAEGVVNRFAGTSKAFPATFDVVTMRGDRTLEQPLRWARPRRVFVNSLSDLFHADVPDAFIARVFAVMAAAPQHKFQLLTKRHGRMRSLLNRDDFVPQVLEALHDLDAPSGSYPWPLPNVWLGVSVEDQKHADLRIPALLATPAAVRWISAEPLLGPITFRWAKWAPVRGADHLDGLRALDWVVVGGESGARARPMHPTWPAQVRDECEQADVPFLFKQWGSWAPGSRLGRVEAMVAWDGETVQPPSALWTAPAAYDADLNCMRWATVHRARDKAEAGRELGGRTHDGYPATDLAAT